MSKPELQAPPDLFYNETEASKYASNSRMIEIQTTLTERAVELLNIPENKKLLLLDIGCGSGFSGDVLSEQGHVWIGVDISKSMLDIAKEREVEGDLILQDMGNGLNFRAGSFDGAISISALQWLCNSYTTDQVPKKRLMVFFQSLYNSLARGARAILQFYPETAEQLEMITSSAMRCGFSGGLVVDYPNSTKAKKHFLCLFAGQSSEYKLPQPIGVDEEDEVPTTATFSNTRRKNKKGKREPVKSREWVLKKKDRQRRQGKDVRPDTKYTARPRKHW